jgi:hypothetical protein
VNYPVGGLHTADESSDDLRPKNPHLVVVTDRATGIAIPEGATLLVVHGKHRHEQYPVVLLGVTRNGLKFRCGCGQSGCTRVANASFKWTGRHPQYTGEAR